MIAYHDAIVATSQFTWYAAIQRLEPATVTRWTVLTPVMGVVFAYFINDHSPSAAQLIGLGLVSIGIAISTFHGAQRRRPRNASACAEASLAGH